MGVGPERNDVLALLPERVKKRVFPLLREVELPLGQEIYAAGQEEEHVYFPADCIVSLLYLMLDGHSAEISVVGRIWLSSATSVDALPYSTVRSWKN